MSSPINLFFEHLQTSFQQNTFIKLNLGNYKGSEPQLKNLYVKPLIIKGENKLSFTYRYFTKDIIKNYAFEEAIALLKTWISPSEFRDNMLFSTEADMQIFCVKNNEWHLKRKKASIVQKPTFEHDKQKNRNIQTFGKVYLQDLKITNEKGEVFKNAQDKYKQINHYIEILSTLLKDLPPREQTNIVDMGAGKGYLTFALYDYLNQVIHKPAQIVGVEFRKDLVDLCNEIAKKSNFDKLSFVEGTIENYSSPQEINVLIALHACDTATDDAIYKGIEQNADLIVVAPCCHKQIRREIEKNKVKNELDFLLKHGIFLERQAEMITDGLRALLLEYAGYSTKVFQFVSDAHTPKNVLIVGEKRRNTEVDKDAILAKIEETKAYFGIGYHHLEKLLKTT